MQPNTQSTIKFLHMPSEELDPIQRLRASLVTTKQPIYGGYSVGYRLINSGALLEMSYAFCMNSDMETRDVFSKAEARALIRDRFSKGDTLKITSMQLAPRCFRTPVSFEVLTSGLIETLVATFSRENTLRLRHHVTTGFVNYTFPALDSVRRVKKDQ